MKLARILALATSVGLLPQTGAAQSSDDSEDPSAPFVFCISLGPVLAQWQPNGEALRLHEVVVVPGLIHPHRRVAIGRYYNLSKGQLTPTMETVINCDLGTLDSLRRKSEAIEDPKKHYYQACIYAANKFACGQ